MHNISFELRLVQMMEADWLCIDFSLNILKLNQTARLTKSHKSINYDEDNCVLDDT